MGVGRCRPPGRRRPADRGTGEQWSPRARRARSKRACAAATATIDGSSSAQRRFRTRLAMWQGGARRTSTSRIASRPTICGGRASDSSTRSSTTFQPWWRSTTRRARSNSTTAPPGSSTVPACPVRSSGDSATSCIRTTCRSSSLHATARSKRASQSKPSRACGARMARIAGSTYAPSDVLTTMARLAGTAFEPTSTTEGLPKMRCGEARPFCSRSSGSVVPEAGGTTWQRTLVESSPEIQRAYAVQPGEDISRPSFWFDRIHPDDRPRVQAQFEQCLREKTDYRAGYRIVLPDGTVRYQYATGQAVTNDAGDLTQFIGASMDMTEHWLATTELERTSAGRTRSSDQDGARRADRHRSANSPPPSRMKSISRSLPSSRTDMPACAGSPRLRQTLPKLSRRPNGSSRMARTPARSFGEYAPCSNGRLSRKCRSISTRSFGEVLRLLDSYPARKHVVHRCGVGSRSAAPRRRSGPAAAARTESRAQCARGLGTGQRPREAVVGPIDAGRSRPRRDPDLQTTGSASTIRKRHSSRSSPRSQRAWAWAWRSAGRSSLLMTGRLSAERNVGFGTTFTVTLPIQPDGSP